MTFKELQNQIEEDLTLEPQNLESKLYTIPVLHSKYLRRYNEAKKKHDRLMLEMDKLYRTKWHLYSTQGYNGHTLDTQKKIIIYVEGDSEILNKRVELNKAKRMVEYMRETVDKVSKMSFDIKNLIECIKWINGGQS
jgi:hypothetical protein